MDRAIAVTLTEPVPKQFGILDGDPAYDEFSLMMRGLPMRAMHLLEGCLRAAGYLNVQSMNSYHHGINGDYSSENYRRLFSSDVVGLGAITRTAKQTLELSRRIKQASPRTRVVLGGPHFIFRYLEGLQEGRGDVVCLGEGQEALIEILETGFDYDKLASVRGIAFRKGEEIIVTPQRELLTLEKLSAVHPYYDDVTWKNTNRGVVETSVGCVFHCEHCQDPIINRGRYRCRSIDYVLKERGKFIDRRSVFYTDNNIAGNKSRLIEMSRKIEEAGLNQGYNICQITSKSLRDPEIQAALKRMGIQMACIGYEHVYDDALSNIGKPCTQKDNEEAARILRELGIWNHGMIMTGGKDTKESLDDTVEWAIKNLDSAQFFPIGNLAETPFDKRMRDEERVICDGIDSYHLGDGHHVVVRPENMTPYELQFESDRMYSKFYSLKNNLWRLARVPRKEFGLAIMMYTNFAGGISRVANSKQHLAHLEFLKSIS